MTKLVYFGAGHGGNGSTPGKRSPAGEYEWNFNDEVARAFESRMKQYKNVKLVRTDDRSGKTDIPLATRTNRANSANADLYLSFHHNAFQSKWGNHGGTETFYYAGNSQGKKLAQLVQNAQLKAYGLRDRGLKTNNLHITRATNMTAVLCEGGFMDSNIDIKKLRDKKVLQRAGKEIADAVASYLGLSLSGSKPTTVKPSKSNTNSAPSNPTPNPSKPTKTKWNDVGNKWAGQNLKLNDRGEAVKQLQKLVGTTSDGMFGVNTQKTVKSAQRKGGIAVDGIAGKDTYRILNNKPSKKPSGNSRIKTVQTTVNSRYNTRITVDGINGIKTKTALLKGYQTELNKQYGANLSVDGIWGNKTLNASVTVRRGAKGNITWLIQARLYCLGYNPNGLDSVFGGGLHKAIKSFQSKNGLTSDGIAGKKTFARLFG